MELLKTIQSKSVSQVQQYVVGLIFRRHSSGSATRIVAVIGVGGGEIAILQTQAQLVRQCVRDTGDPLIGKLGVRVFELCRALRFGVDCELSDSKSRSE
jgi:hypothetical protein